MTVIDSRALGRLVERNPLVAALVLSLVIHVGVYGGWQLGKQLGWWKHHPAWLINFTRWVAKPRTAQARVNRPPENRAIPMTFVEIDPETASAEPPENAKFYSSKNAKAANPDPNELQSVKVDGKQDQIVRLMENDKPKPLPLQPAPPREIKEDVIPPKPKSDAPGDLALVRPKPPSDGQVDTTTGAAQQRPRTVNEAKERKGLLAGALTRQEGGVSRKGSVSFDVRSSIWGDYDLTLIKAIETKWYEIIDAHTGTRKPGKVVVTFVLNYHGYVKSADIVETTVGELQATMCQSAIIQAQSFGEWTAEMRRDISSTTRLIQFTFYYNGQ